MSAVEVKKLTVGYGKKNILNDLNINIPTGKVSVLIGSNGSGKSTLLKTIAGIIPAIEGQILVNGKDLNDYKRKDLAKILSFLPQKPNAPENINVHDLLAQAYSPKKRSFFKSESEQNAKIKEVLSQTNTTDYEYMDVHSLSGGQLQRVWIAFSLMQDAEIMFLDEPTTYLDLTYQLEVLECLKTLNEEYGKTIVLVLHDLNLVARYADYIIAVNEHEVYDAGETDEVINERLLKDVFHLESRIECDEQNNCKYVIPLNKAKEEN